jgi:hypothetical protein
MPLDSDSIAAEHLLRRAWHIYLAQAVSSSASTTQITETRRAFYAGAAAVMAASLPDPGISEETRLAVLRSIHRELEHFSAAVNAGAA